jgi:hypothetical protein
MELEEDHFVAGFHQQVQKVHEKDWHDRQIKKNFQTMDLVLLYDNKFLEHPRKLHMHWLGPYVIRYVAKVGVVQLEKLDREAMEGIVNKSRLKL